MSAAGRKLLCDEMLTSLGRWLRAAGHDTAIAGRGHDDGALVAWAAAEGRLLVTRDRAIAERRAPAAEVVVLAENGLEANAVELARRLDLDWLAAPFTRCLVDNAPLRPAEAGERRAVPAEARRLGGPLNACPACGRLYWPGSHVRRMRARLERWQALSRGEAAP